MSKRMLVVLVVAMLWSGAAWAMMAEHPIATQAIRLAQESVGAPFSANAHGDPLRSDPPRSFVCSSFVTWTF